MNPTLTFPTLLQATSNFPAFTHPIPSHPIPLHPIPLHPIPSHEPIHLPL
jgi:hypothetical protein